MCAKRKKYLPWFQTKISLCKLHKIIIFLNTWWCLCFKIYEWLVIMSLSYFGSRVVFTSVFFTMTDYNVRALEGANVNVRRRLSLYVAKAVEIQFWLK